MEKNNMTDPCLPFSFLDRQIPTILSYVGGDEYYGQQAKAFLVRNPKNTVAYFKDFLGQEYALHHSLYINICICIAHTAP